MSQPGTSGPSLGDAQPDAERPPPDSDVEPAAPQDRSGAPDAPQTPEQLTAELEELRAQRTRAVADYQNLRRRQAEERQEYLRLTQKAAVLNYLPVLDDLNRALDSVSEHAEIAEHPWIEGVRMVQRKFMALLEASGAKEIEAEGVAFDPTIHEAVSYQTGPAGQVVAVVQSGYTIDGLVVRPAMVVVGSGEDGSGEDGGGTEKQTEADAGAGVEAAVENDEEAER